MFNIIYALVFYEFYLSFNLLLLNCYDIKKFNIRLMYDV